MDALLEQLAAITGPEHVLGPDAEDDRVDRAVLHLSRSPAEIAVMRAVKSAFDPAGILNPDALFPPGTG